MVRARARTPQTKKESNIISIIDMIRLNRYKWANMTIATVHVPTAAFVVVATAFSQSMNE